MALAMTTLGVERSQKRKWNSRLVKLLAWDGVFFFLLLGSLQWTAHQESFLILWGGGVGASAGLLPRYKIISNFGCRIFHMSTKIPREIVTLVLKTR